jgi:hypothetical protein
VARGCKQTSIGLKQRHSASQEKNAEKVASEFSKECRMDDCFHKSEVSDK